MKEFQREISGQDKEKRHSRKLLNTEQAANYLNIKKQTLYNWRYYRKGPDYVMIGRRPMYDINFLDRYIDSYRVKLNA